MSVPKPYFKLARVYSDGTQEEAEIVPVTQLPWETKTTRRGFLGAGVTAAAVLGALSTTSCAPLNRSLNSALKLAHLKDACADALAHRADVRALAVSTNGNLLASGGDLTIKLWRLPDGALMKTIDAHTRSVENVAVSRDGKLLASADTSTIKLWGLPEGTLLKTIELGGSSVLSPLTISADESFLISAHGRTIKLWTLPQGDPLKTIEGHSDNVSTLVVSADGKFLVSGSVDHTIRIWTLPQGMPVSTMQGHTSTVRACVLNQDGTVLISASDDKTVRLWRLPEGTLLKTLEGHSAAVTSLAITPDDRVVISGSNDKTIKLWSLPDGTLLKTLDRHTDGVKALAVATNGTLLFSGGADTTVRLWELPEGTFKTCLLDLKVSMSTVEGVTYESRNEYGHTISYTLPCGSPVPAGAICTCNCVPGAIAPPTPSASGNSYCTCVPVCVCMAVPVCQGHRLLDEDPLVRVMAEELLLLMGAREFEYMMWAATKAEPPVKIRIKEIMVAIKTGAKPNPDRWPTTEECIEYLNAADEVVAVMAAQILCWRQLKYRTQLEDFVQRHVDHLLTGAKLRPWFTREENAETPSI